MFWLPKQAGRVMRQIRCCSSVRPGPCRRYRMRLMRNWRKRAGVEPTRDRLAASLGFEVRTPHQGRFSSITVAFRMRQGTEQVQTMLVDPAQVVTIESDPVTVEEFENLDGDFPAIIEAVAKLCGGENSILSVSRNVSRNGHHFLDGRAQEKMVMRHFVSPSQASCQFE